MKKRWIVLLGLFLLIVCVYAKGIRVKPFPADLDKATTMILQSGNTGTRITITDPEEIQNVRDMMEKRFYLTQRISPRDGWTYRIIFEAENEEILLDVTVGEGTFKHDDVIYFLGDHKLWDYMQTYDDVFNQTAR